MTVRAVPSRVHRRRSRAAALLVAVALAIPVTPVALAVGTTAAAAETAAAYRDPTVPVEQRVRDLLGRMTLEEKVGQMTQAERGAATADPTLVADLTSARVLSGGGSAPDAEHARRRGPTWSTASRRRR